MKNTKNVYILVVFTLICYGFTFDKVYAQNAAPENELRITFPTPEILKKELDYEQIRFAGVTSPHAKLSLTNLTRNTNKEPVDIKVYPSGAFVGLIELKPGKNEFEFKSETIQSTCTYVLTVHRQPAVTVTHNVPVNIDKSFCEPKDGLVLLPGDILRVKFKGTPCGKASFSIPGLRKNMPMTELTVTSKSVAGIYTGHYVVQPGDKVENTKIRFHLTTENGADEAVSPGEVQIDSGMVLRTGMVAEDYGLMYSDPDTSRSYPSMLCAGTKLVIIGESGNYYKIKLTKDIVGWINKKQVKLLSLGTPPPKATIYAVTVSTVSEKSTRIYINVNDKVPYTVEEILYPPAIELTLYGAISDSEWTTFYTEEKNVKQLKIVHAAENVIKLHADLSGKQLWGYEVCYSTGSLGSLIWDIKSPPRILSEFGAPLKGLTVFVDVGHGGEDDKGAIGPTGLMEKEVNLDMSLSLRDKLRSAGANVIMCREEDNALSWQERFKLARESKADIYLMMHNNSIPDNWNPLRARGVSTFYGYSSGLELTKIIFNKLTEIGLPPAYYIYRTPYRNQPTNMVLVLIEAAFISHPEDEMLLLDKNFRKKIGEAVYNGVEEYIKKIMDDK